MEQVKTLNGITFSSMLRSGAMNLKKHVQEINDLNVFPIPDGDTGSNMLLTIMGGVDAIDYGEENIAVAARKAADGMLLSARGNSGVILSQLFDGIAAGFNGVKAATNTELSHAMQLGVKTAYGAVLEATEGTILTVARCAAEYASDSNVNTIDGYFDTYITEAKSTLDKTPDMLPVLKKAGVVDSGGAGLVSIIEGMYSSLTGEEIESIDEPLSKKDSEQLDINLFDENSVLEFGYCTEFLLRLQTAKTNVPDFDVNVITDYLKTVGDSVVAFKTGSIVKVHVHTMTPHKVLEFCQRYGEFLTLKIENMSLQHNNTTAVTEQNTERKKIGVVSVCSGEGIKQMFLDSGADIIVDGGQSMNPATEDFIEAFNKLNAETIIVLPNNGNIILAAKQAASFYTASKVYVLESKNIGAGYAALSMFDPDAENVDELIENLNFAMEGVVTAEISHCVRDAVIDDVSLNTGDYIGVSGKKYLASSQDRLSAACNTLEKLSISDYEICIVIRGKDTDKEEANKVLEYVNKNYKNKDVYLIDGMQDIYDYILILQ